MKLLLKVKFALFLVLGFIAYVLMLVQTNSQVTAAMGGVDLIDDPVWFSPDSLSVSTGSTVPFRCMMNCDTAHTVTSIAGPVSFDSGVFGPMQSWNYTFNKSGLYEYICAIHPYMHGYVAVGVAAPAPRQWPPNVAWGSKPTTPGVGEIWVDTQFEQIPGKDDPGSIQVIDAATWTLKRKIPIGNNPHNNWLGLGDRYMVQTSWHGNYFSVVDTTNGNIVVNARTIGKAPAHVMSKPDGSKFYMTVNGENWVGIINPSNWSVEGKITTALGPHGIWISPDGTRALTADALSNKASILDLTTNKEIAQIPVGRLPLAASLTRDGKKGYISNALAGSVSVIDMVNKRLLKTISVGSVPVQVPVSPDNKYVVVALTGSAKVAIIAVATDTVVKTLSASSGAHGVAYGAKQGGGYYAYVTNKYADHLTVIDLTTLTKAGDVPLDISNGRGTGGQGLLVKPNPYSEWK